MDYNDSCSNFSEDLRSPSSSVENDGSNAKPQFLESLKMIESFAELLVCVICGKLPQEKVYTLGRCFHKYCEKCVEGSAGKPCVVCGEKGYPKDAKPDIFSSSILLEIPKVYKVLTNLQDMSCAGSTGGKKKALTLRTPPPEFVEIDEEMEEDNQNELEDDDEIVADEAEIEFDPGASEKARDNLHLNAITFSTLEGNDAENDGDQHEKNKPQEEVPPMIAYDVYDFNESTPSSGINKKQNASPDVLEETPQNKPRSHRLEEWSSSRKYKGIKKGVRCLDFVPVKNKNERGIAVDAGLEKRKKEAEIPTKAKLGKKISTPLKTPDEEPIFSDEELFKSQSCQGDSNEAGPKVQVADLPVLTPYIPTVQDKTSTLSELPKQSTNTLGKGTSRSDRSSGEQEPPTLTPNVKIVKGTRSESKRNRNTSGSKVKTQPNRRTIRRKSSPAASAVPEWLSKTKSSRRKRKSADYLEDDDDSPNFKPTTKILPSVKVRSRRSSASSVTKVALLSPLSSSSFSDSFSSSKREKEKKNAKGETKLHIACRAGQVDRVKSLVEDGFDVDAKDNAGWTPLHEVVNSKKTSKENIMALIRILHEKGCNMNAVGGSDQETVLHLAVQNGIEEIVAILLELGASPNIRNEWKQLPRDFAYNDVIANMLDEKAGKCIGGENAANTSNDGSTTSNYDSALTNVGEDPAVLQVMLDKALIHFTFEVSKEEVLATKTLLKLRVAPEFAPKVTHIVHDVNEKKNGHFYVPLTFEYLYGLAKGLWQVSYGWIQESMKSSKCLSPKPFEIGGYYTNANSDSLVFGAPMKSRVNHDNGFPGLLNGFEFYLYKSCGYSNGNLDLNKKDLDDLINAAGGKVINREPNPNQISPLDYPSRFHTQDSSSSSMKLTLTTHIILYDDKAVPSKKYTMEHVKTLKSDWLIESLANFQLQDPDHFL